MPTIDADCHVIETEQTWNYMEEPELALRPVPVAATDPNVKGRKEYLIFDGKLVQKPGGDGSAKTREVLSGRARTSLASRTMQDLGARLRDMDELGVDVQVLFPTVFLHLRPAAPRPQVEVAVSRSYNRWLADVCGQAPDRLRWVAVLPLRDMQESIAQLRFAREHGACGIFTMGFEGERLLVDPYFYPLYEAAQELDIPICVHSGAGTESHLRLSGGEPFTSSLQPVLGAFHSILFHDLPDMFPKLRFGFLEASADWLPFVINDLRRRLEREGRQLAQHPLRDNRMWVACQTNDNLPHIIQYVGDDNLVIGSDYGHADTASELEALRNLRQDPRIPPVTAKKILEENPKALFGL